MQRRVPFIVLLHHKLWRHLTQKLSKLTVPSFCTNMKKCHSVLIACLQRVSTILKQKFGQLEVAAEHREKQDMDARFIFLIDNSFDVIGISFVNGNDLVAFEHVSDCAHWVLTCAGGVHWAA